MKRHVSLGLTAWLWQAPASGAIFFGTVITR
jgi:hypothetical protein